MDNVQVRTAEQLEKKYNLSKLAKSVANIEVNSKDIIHIQQELDDFIDATTGQLQIMEEQIDGKVDTYYYNGIPSLLNYPANEWDEEDYPHHIGDLYFDKTTGIAYIFSYSSSTYKWDEVRDSGVSQALSAASAAQDTADSKRRIFTSQPSPPYDVGDLWTQGSNGDIKVCNNARTSGSYTASDWILSSKYTDDSSLNTFVSTTYTNAITALTNSVNEKITTWYLTGAPTLSNNPAVNWDNDEKLLHIGDLYYDKSTGYTYRFENDSGYKWTRIKDSQITEAMSTANAAQDTADGKRRIFMIQPTPPYDNGDLWLVYNNGNPGDIKACQISKTQGQSFDANDWIAASKYTDDTIANAIVDEMGGTTTQVLSGQVVTIMSNYAKFTDLATGGSTEIAGENITTGNIKSSNYVAGTSGTNINLTTGKISTPNVNIDNDGIKLSNGAKVVGSNGLKNTYLYTGKSEKNFVGFLQDYFGSVSVKKLPNIIDISIPDGLEVTKAILHLYHSPVTYYIYDYDTGTEIFDTMGYVRNAKVYKASNIGSREIAVHTSEYDLNDTTTYTDTQITWYKNGVSQGASYTPVTPTQQSHNLEEVYTSDFSGLFKSGGATIPGMYEFKVETSDAAVQTWDDQDIKARTGWCYAEIEIEGYMTYS